MRLDHHEIAIALYHLKFNVDVLGGLDFLNARSFDDGEMFGDKYVIL